MDEKTKQGRTAFDARADLIIDRLIVEAAQADQPRSEPTDRTERMHARLKRRAEAARTGRARAP